MNGPLKSARSPVEEEAHFGMWCIMSSPLLIGCDLESIPPESLALLKNSELIAVNQDPLHLQAYPVKTDVNGATVFVKDIIRRHGLTRAVAFYNPTDSAVRMEIPFQTIGMGGNVKVRDLTHCRDMGVFSGRYDETIPAHGAECSKKKPVLLLRSIFIPAINRLMKTTGKLR